MRGRVPGPFLRDGPASIPCLRSLTGILNTLANPLPIANGGTNGTAAPTAGGVPYGTGTKYAFTGAGTAGQVLTSAGAGAPTWQTPAVPPTPDPAMILSVLTDDSESHTVAPDELFHEWNWELHTGNVLSLHAVLAVLGTATAAPRFEVMTTTEGEWPAVNGTVRYLEFTTSATTPVWQHLRPNVLTTSVTSSVITTISYWDISAVLLAPGNCTMSLWLASSTDDQNVKVLKGSTMQYHVL